jgi:hypothetical protein
MTRCVNADPTTITILIGMTFRMATPALAAALTGCTASPPEKRVDFTSAVQIGTPTIVKIPIGEIIVLSELPNPTYLQPKYWSASIDNPVILTFSPTNSSGRAATLPLFTGVKDGETTAVLTYTGGAIPERTTFNVAMVGP